MLSKTNMNNNVNTKLVYIYENLPSGGAKELYLSNVKYLKTKYKLRFLSDKSESKGWVKNFFSYIYYSIFIVNKISKKLAKQTNSGSALVAYHSWITKSPDILRYTKIPTLYICHEPPREFYDSYVISKFGIRDKIANVIRFYIKYVDLLNVRNNKQIKIIANSQYSAKVLAQIYRQNPEVVYPGIHLAEYGNYTGLGRRENTIICVGAINKIKNQEYILEVVKEIEKSIRPQVILVGNGADENYKLKLINNAKVNDIRLSIKLNIERRKLISLYKSSRILLYPVANEPFGMVALEAMRAGLPIVGRVDGGGYTEILDKNSGYFFNNENGKDSTKQVSEKVKYLLLNDEYWNKVSNFNYKLAGKYSDVKMNVSLNKILQNMILRPQ